MATTMVFVGEYLRTSYEPDAEYVDGVIEERPVGERDHSEWQAAIVSFLLANRKQWNIRAGTELRVQVKAERFRVPDVAVYSPETIEQILTTPPFAVFEILSPEDQMSKLTRKLADYVAMGIRNIFVVDPQNRVAYRYSEGEYRRCLEVERIDGTPAEVDWKKIEAIITD